MLQPLACPKSARVIMLGRWWYLPISELVVLVALMGCGAPRGEDSAGSAGGSVSETEVCPVAELVAEVASVEGLAADGSGVFWMDGGIVRRVDDVDPGAPRILGIVASEGPTGTGNRLAVSETHVYASGLSGVLRISKDGATVPELVTAPLARVHALAVTSDGLFVGRRSWVSDPGSLFRFPLAGGEPEMLRPDGWVYDLEADGEEIYWSDFGTSSAPVGAQVGEGGRLGRFGPDGIAVIHEGLVGAPAGLALDAEFLYWADYHDGAVARTPRAGGPRQIVAELDVPRDFVVAAEGSYIARDVTDEIPVLLPGSSEPQCFAALPQGTRGDPKQIALSNEFVYVLTSVGGEYVGSIVRAPRRPAE